ncbi:MAG: hypothetical protein RMZ41_001785 [Nostoc sp. DedVER02]|uniref:hypothetical protein n=1 Tax=unclassified Nostoc TaxID=2593658 RepID=UPI002AD20977|nr:MULTISPECIES: hypothetical protein [unclassified Nostoc]MDZ7987110.1 hypothetical protein [Nostoc sp. DedVER02]MDZ8111020.1 hypothetical protein [Nostoc sp. DedVER01b]
MTIINPPSNSATKLKSAIEAIAPEVDSTVLDELCRLTRIHNLKWVADKNGKNAYYVMADLSVAKGLDAKDYAYNWADKTKSTSGVENNPLESLPGKAFKLEGENLANFKKLYKEQNGISLGKINSLWVGDFLHAYSYLVQGRSEAAKDFQSLGAKSIEVASTNDLQHTIEPDLQLKIMELAGYSNINLKFEVAVVDSFSPGSHRRWDFVERLPKVTKLYELKSRTLSEDNVRSTLFTKKYIELASERFPGKPIEFIFTSPRGISWEAKSLIQEVNEKASTLYPGIKVKVSFIDTQEITERLINNILNDSPIESHFWFKRKLETEGFNCVVSSRTVERLNTSIVDAYQTGRLIRKAKPDNVIQLPKLKNTQAA